MTRALAEDTRPTGATEGEIDRLVYDLYNPTDEEIATVDGSS